MMNIIRDPAWQFVGVALTLLIPFAGWCFARWRKTKSQVISTNDHFDEAGPEYKVRPSPGEIIDELEALPPMQREAAIKNYIGLPIKFHGFFYTAEPLVSNIWQISLFPPGGVRDRDRVVVHIVVDTEEHKELKILKKGHRLWVAGRIEHINYPLSMSLGQNVLLKIDNL